MTKFFADSAAVREVNIESAAPPQDSELVEKIYLETKAEVLKLGFLAQPTFPAATLGIIIDGMSLSQLYDLKKAFLGEVWGDLKPQICAKYDDGNNSFKLA